MIPWLFVILSWAGPMQGSASGRTSRVEQQERVSVTLRFTPPHPARTVTVAGSFNGWNREATPLRKQADGDAWSVTLSLEPGVYAYKFVVNGDEWYPDPNAPKIDDGNGNTNSSLGVTPEAYARQPGRIGDGLITSGAVRHLSNGLYIQRLDRTHIALRLRTRRDDVRSCAVEAHPSGRSPATPRAVPMMRQSFDPLYDFWRAELSLPANGPFFYTFRVQDGNTVRDLDDREQLVASSTSPTHWFRLNPADYPPFETPDWARDAVFYQIFSDRFADGNLANDGADTQPWGSRPTYFNRMGGDLDGVLQHLDYLRNLGVNALYFNPVFSARSNHGYDTTDYLRIDPHYGTNETLKTLTTKIHTLGWHVILDGVFNHTGVDFAQFRSLRDDGPTSPYRDWYFVKSFPIEVRDGQAGYVGWFGSPWMPKLNTANPETRRFLLDVAKRWIVDAHIDGWRLDAADEVPHDYWKLFRQTVRQADPRAYIVGEIWGNAQSWLQGDQFDSVMNYRWRGAVLDFFATDRLKPSAFDAALKQIREDYPPAASAVMFNVLDSHDTERIRTLCKGDGRKQRQAALFQLTYPGTPCIYYGDEIGLEGGRDPDDRRAMPWDKEKWDQATLTFYRKVLALRSQIPALRRGTFRVVTTDDASGIFGFERVLGKGRVLVFFNRGDSERSVSVPRGGLRWTERLNEGARITSQNDRLTVTLPARGAALLVGALQQD